MSLLFKLAAVCDKCGARCDYETEDVKHGESPDYGREMLRVEDIEHVIALPDGWKEVNITLGEYQIHCKGCIDGDTATD